MDELGLMFSLKSTYGLYLAYNVTLHKNIGVIDTDRQTLIADIHGSFGLNF